VAVFGAAISVSALAAALGAIFCGVARPAALAHVIVDGRLHLGRQIEQRRLVG